MLPQTKKLTYEEFLEIANNDEIRAEFIDGVIYYQATPTLRHQEIILNIGSELRNHFRGKLCRPFTAPHDIVFKSGDNIRRVQPDLFVLCGNIDLDKNEFEGIPDLIIEVLSPSNAWYDVSEKLKLYQSVGVKEYWIVKPKSSTVDIYTLEKDVYGEPMTYSKDDIVRSEIFADLSMELERIFE